MKLSELVRTERERKGWSVRKLAVKASVDPSAVSRMERGLQVGHAETIAKVAIALGLDPAIVQGAVSGDQEVAYPPRRELTEVLEEALAQARRLRESETRYQAAPGKIVMVPIVESFVAAGEGAVAEVERWPYRPTPEQAGHQFIAVWVKGTCLEPRVHDGELAVIDKDAVPTVGDVVAVQVDGESLLRIFQGNRLTALNLHPPIPLDGRAHLEGVVVSLTRKP